MLKIKFKNGFEGTLVDWTPYMVIQEVGVLKRNVESDNPGEAGLIVFDNLALSFRYEQGSVVYNAFNEGLDNAVIYIFEVYAIKSDKEEIKIFEGIADFTTIEWNINEKTISFEVVDKIKALDFLSGAEMQKEGLNDCIGRMSCADYVTDYVKRSLSGLGVWIEIQTYNLINNNGVYERGDAIPHTQVILEKGEIFYHPGEDVGLCLVTDAELMSSMGGWATTFVKIHPVKSSLLSLSLSAAETTMTVKGNVFGENDIVYLENGSQVEFLKIINEGFGSEVSWIYNVERHCTGGDAYDWSAGEKVVYSNVNITYITDLSSPAENTHLLYYDKTYYGQTDINIYGSDSFGRSALKAFDAISILKAIVSKTLSPLNFVNRTGAGNYPVSLNYYMQLYGVSPFGKHPLEAVKLLADSMRCYIFIDRQGRFVIQKKSILGNADSGNERAFDPVRIAASSIPRRYFWDKLIDGVEAKIITEGSLSASVTKQIFPNITPRNELSKEIIAIDSIEFTAAGLSDYASEVADEYLDFYGTRHESFSVSIPIYDGLFEWELLDYILFEGKICFFTGFEIDLTEREFTAELVTIQRETYYKGQANVALSLTKYNSASNGGVSTGAVIESSSSSSETTYTQYSAETPIFIESSTVKLDYEDNLKLSANERLDTVQGIKTSSSPQFAAIAVGGEVDSNYKGKFYGDIKVTGKIVTDGDIQIGGSVNQVNVTELYVADKTINLNKGGSDSTAPESGIKILGASGITAASIIYDSQSNWYFDKDINLPLNIKYKINNVAVLSSDTLGSGIINSSLSKVGTITQGIWNGSPVNASYINYNTSHFQNTNNQLASKTITASSSNGIIVSGTFNPGGSIIIDTPQDIRTSSSPVFNGVSLSNGMLNSGSDLTISLSGTSIIPASGYAYNLGSISKKYLTLYASELCVETLVSRDTKATVGGRMLIGETNELIYDVLSSDTFINVKYNSFTAGDVIYLESAGKVEFMKILSLASSGENNYEYQVQRTLDGSGANEWFAGDALFNTGNIGDGFIDMYSIKGIKGSSQPGPAITGNVRNSLAYNDWSEHWAIGNLQGLYGFTSNTFGVGFGKYGNSSSYVTIDSVNGFAIKHKNSSGSETKMIELDSSGNGYFRGNINSSAVITGGVFQTASTGKRVCVDGVENNIKYYNSAGDYITVEGYLSSANEKRLHIGGALMGDGDLSISGKGSFAGNIRSSYYVDAVKGFMIDEMPVIDEDYNASFNNITGNEINGVKYLFAGNELISSRPEASKILISDSNRKITASSVPSGELFIPAYAELDDETATSTITCDGSSYVKWTNAAAGLTKGIEGNISSDCIIISAGYTGKYEARYSVSFNAGIAGNYYWAIKIGSFYVAKSRSFSYAPLNTAVSISGGALLSLSEGEQVSIGCYGPNNGTVSVIYLNLRIIKVSN